MAHDILSPNNGLFSDEEEAAIFESTSAGFGAGLRKDLLSDFSVISPGMAAPAHVAETSQVLPEDGNRKVKVFLRIRPFKEVELEKRENQGCVNIEDSESLLLRAPKDSFTMKNSERGVGQGMQRFTFSQIFGPDVDQKQFFEGTMKQVVKEALNGQNWLVYTYGVTNSGKTYTIQGNSKDGGILPRSLSLIFSSIQDRLHKGTDLKPSLSSEVVWLDSRQVRQEELKKAALLSSLREEELFTPLKRSLSTDPPTNSTSFDSGVAGLSSTSQFNTQTNSLLEDTSSRWAYSDAVSLEEPDESQFSIWVSFFEIYNEFIYDLLDSGPNNGKRQSLRLCEDKNGSPYVKDLNWINVCDADEAWRILRVGRKNQSFASTHLNQSSSRSHSIFSIRILHLQGGTDLVPKISELSLCDLAGSERCKDQKIGDRMKEATNINTSLHTLGRCIAALRQNQLQKLKQNIVPFRDSKLTRVFQGFFTGRGQSCMIVNINQCASTYDETLHALKFSAIANQLVQAPIAKLKIPSIKSLIREHSRANRSLEVGEDVEVMEEEEEEEELDSDESCNEGDVTMFNREDLMQAVEAMKELLLKERQEKLELEMRLRKEICEEMVEEMQAREASSSEYVEREKELLEEMYESRMENFKDSFTKYYQQELQEREERIDELEAALQARSGTKAVPASSRKPEVMGNLGVEEEHLRRSERVASSKTLQQELVQAKQELLETKVELATCQEQLRAKCKDVERYERLRDPPPTTSRCFTVDVDRKLEEGQKNVRLLRAELQKLGDSLQSAERSCCHNTSARKLRITLNTCEDILAKQAQSLAELQNNMTLVKMDLKRKVACIAEQYNTVHKLQDMPFKKRQCNGAENMTPNQNSGKKFLLGKFLPKTPVWQNVSESPYGRILRSRQTPGLKTVAFGTKY
ncbi:kinesin-like protein KIF20A isoform X2 [Lissotriton helveticus]